MEEENKYLMAVIDSLNTQVQVLKDAGMTIHDEADFEFVVDYIYYSPAQGKLIAKFKHKGEIEK